MSIQTNTMINYGADLINVELTPQFILV